MKQDKAKFNPAAVSASPETDPVTMLMRTTQFRNYVAEILSDMPEIPVSLSVEQVAMAAQRKEGINWFVNQLWSRRGIESKTIPVPPKLLRTT